MLVGFPYQMRLAVNRDDDMERANTTAFMQPKEGIREGEKMIRYGEAGINELVQWLKSMGEPQDIAVVVRKYLELLCERKQEE